MRGLVACVLLIAAVYGRPAQKEPPSMKDIIDSMKLDIDEMLPKELTDNFTPELQEFIKSIDFMDIFAVIALSQKRDKIKSPEDLLDALRGANVNTYEKVIKLIDSYKRRYEALTPGAKKYFEEREQADAKISVMGFGDLKKLTKAERKERIKGLQDAFQKLADEDKQSLQAQLPLLYKILSDPEFIEKLQPKIEQKIQEQMAKMVEKKKAEAEFA
ncbi:unnamed protein product, partial [Mesorhabditis spiculigera]